LYKYLFPGRAEKRLAGSIRSVPALSLALRNVIIPKRQRHGPSQGNVAYRIVLLLVRWRYFGCWLGPTV
jgi:hypothetical protein